MKLGEFLHFCIRAKYAKIIGVLLEYAKSTVLLVVSLNTLKDRKQADLSKFVTENKKS